MMSVAFIHTASTIIISKISPHESVSLNFSINRYVLSSGPRSKFNDDVELHSE